VQQQLAQPWVLTLVVRLLPLLPVLLLPPLLPQQLLPLRGPLVEVGGQGM
jgi:hypothetical protein